MNTVRSIIDARVGSQPETVFQIAPEPGMELTYAGLQSIGQMLNRRLASIGVARGDKVAFLLSFDDGSMGAVQYLGSGHRAFPKERLEVFCDGRVLQLDNFRRLRSFGWRTVRSRRYWRQDKGHRASLAAFVAAIQAGGPAPIPLAEIREVTELSFDVVRAAESGETIRRAAVAEAKRSA